MANEATVLTLQWSRQEAVDIKLFSLAPSRPWEFIPGQVATLAVEGTKESYFAIASPPEQRETIEFLIKKGGGVAEALFSAAAGAQVLGKGPLGRGFPISRYPGRDLVLVGVGSAIAPLRGVVKSLCRRRHDFGKVVVVYGVRQSEDFCFRSEITEWREAGVKVVQTVSRPEGTDWQGNTGYVQSHLGSVLRDLSQPVALICGMKEMIEQTRDRLVSLGVAAQEVLTNF